jgi:hypothetical protein
MSPTHTWGEKETQKNLKPISLRHLSAQAFRRAVGVPARTRSCRTRVADGEVAPLSPAHPAEHPCKPPRPRARAEPATPFLTGDKDGSGVVPLQCDTDGGNCVRTDHPRAKVLRIKGPDFPGLKTVQAKRPRSVTGSVHARPGPPDRRRPPPPTNPTQVTPLWSHGEPTLLPLLRTAPDRVTRK